MTRTTEPIVIQLPAPNAVRPTNEAHAVVDGYDLWFSAPTTIGQTVRGDAFLAAALLPAMRTGRPIHVSSDLPVSPVLLHNLGILQGIFIRWYDWATPIEIVAETITPAPKGRQLISLFSGGVDSSYTLLRHRNELDGLLFVAGVDVGRVVDSAVVARVVERHVALAARFNLEMLIAGTNVKAFGHAFGIHWHQQIGAGLAAVAMANNIGTLLFPSSSSWADLSAFGTHPITDPLWATEGTTLVHDAPDMRRVDKLAALAAAPILLDSLRVCMEGLEVNCGRCEKCLRTMAGLRALGLSSAAVPDLEDVRALRNVDIRFAGILEDWTELLEGPPAHADPALESAIRRLVRRWQTRYHLRELDALLTGGRGRRWIRAILPR